MPALDEMEKLILGRLPSGEVDRLAVEYANESGLARLAESLESRRDPVLDTLRNLQTRDDNDMESLIQNIQVRLRSKFSDSLTKSYSPRPTEDGPDPERLEYFRVDGRLGQGGMGTVYLGYDTRLERPVALKTLRTGLAASEKARDRFKKEAHSIARLDHHHIVPIYYVGEQDGIPFIVMPFLKGGTLDERLKKKPLSLPEILAVGEQTATGLAAAHARGLVHRDIKPGNLWLAETEPNADRPQDAIRVKILDFGLARSVADEEGDTPLTQSGAILGTPPYMSPEQARGELLDARSDLFSLGCVLYEMAAGRRPFTGPTPMAVLTSLAVDHPAPVTTLNPGVPPALGRLIEQLLEKDPAKRPANALAVAAALRQMATEASPPEPVTVLPRPAKRPSWANPLVALSLLVIIGLGFGAYKLILQAREGTLIVEINDPETEAVFKNGRLEIRDADGTVKYTLKPSDKNKSLPPGEYKVTVEGVDGLTLDTRAFEMKKRGQVTVRVTAEPVQKALATDTADRKAADYILSVGGKIRVVADGRETEVEAPAGLPKTPFTLTWVELDVNSKVTDDGLAVFKDCKNLTRLDLMLAKVTDAGLAHFRGCVNLEQLRLDDTVVTDAGLANFNQCKKLTDLRLNRMRVTDKGLAHFRNCLDLIDLHLTDTQVTDAGMAVFQDCRKLFHIGLGLTKITDAGIARLAGCVNLRNIDFNGCNVSDAGLAHLKDCKELRNLVFHNTPIGDAGLAHFKDCKELSGLILNETKVTDKGLALLDCRKLLALQANGTGIGDPTLARLKDSPKLVELYVRRTKATPAAIANLRKMLPGCRMETDGGVLEPRTDLVADRKAAEYVLSLGGVVKINDRPADYKAAADLPVGPFRLTFVDLRGNPKVNDASLAVFAGCKDVEELDLRDTKFTDAAMERLKDCKSLKKLFLDYTPVGDAGLAHFRGCDQLEELGLGDTAVTDAGLTVFKNCKNLAGLVLSGTKITNAGLAAFKDCNNLRNLTLTVTSIGDDGVKVFKDCPRLKHLDLGRTKITDAGLAVFADYQELELLELTDCRVTDTGLARFKDLTKLKVLGLSGTDITDAGLTRFKDCKQLESLWLASKQFTDAGLAHFKKCDRLTTLGLPNSRVTDAGLAWLAGSPALTRVWLDDTSVGDATLARLAECKQLVGLGVQRTKVTAKGVETFRTALPKCSIHSNFGNFSPPMK